MLGKAARIRSRICDVILGLVTKRHLKREHNLHQAKNISDSEVPKPRVRKLDGLWLAKQRRECYAPRSKIKPKYENLRTKNKV